MMRLLIMFLLVLPMKLFSQDVIFCERVDNTGNPKNVAKEFTIKRDGGFFNVLVKLNKKVDCKNVIFDLYSFKDGKESFENSIHMSVEPTVTWFYKEITFFKEGEFHIYIYDERDKLLGVGKVYVKVL